MVGIDCCRSWNWTQLISVLAYFVINVLYGSISTVQNTFLPQIAETKNASTLEYTTIIASYQGAILMSSPFVALLLNYDWFTVEKLFIMGMVVEAVSSISFGLINWINERLMFVGAGIILRLIQGLGASLTDIGMYALVAKVFIGRKSRIIMGLMESFVLIGFAIGPVFGTSLFEIGGFFLPYGISGALSLLCALGSILVFSLPSSPGPIDELTPIVMDKNKNEFGTISINKIIPNISGARLWLKPNIFLYLFIIFSTCFIYTFNTSILEPYLRKSFRTSSMGTGVILSISGILGAVFSPVAGILGMNKSWSFLLRFVIWIGLILSILGSIVVGPLDILRVQPSYTLSFIGMCLISGGSGICLFPSFSLMLDETEHLGYEIDEITTAFVTGYYTMYITLGTVTGPLVAGLLYDTVGFPNAQWFNIALFILTTLLFGIQEFKQRISKFNR